jgi:hypothetical protein
MKKRTTQDLLPPCIATTITDHTILPTWYFGTSMTQVIGDLLNFVLLLGLSVSTKINGFPCRIGNEFESTIGTPVVLVLW